MESYATQAEMEGDSFEPTEADMERIEQAIEVS